MENVEFGPSRYSAILPHWIKLYESTICFSNLLRDILMGQAALTDALVPFRSMMCHLQHELSIMLHSKWFNHDINAVLFVSTLFPIVIACDV